MATWAAEQLADGNALAPVEAAPSPIPAEQLFGAAAAPATYKMSGQDHVTTARDTWVVSGNPDTTGAQYTGALATPLRDIVVSTR